MMGIFQHFKNKCSILIILKFITLLQSAPKYFIPQTNDCRHLFSHYKYKDRDVNIQTNNKNIQTEMYFQRRNKLTEKITESSVGQIVRTGDGRCVFSSQFLSKVQLRKVNVTRDPCTTHIVCTLSPSLNSKCLHFIYHFQKINTSFTICSICEISERWKWTSKPIQSSVNKQTRPSQKERR